MAMRLSEIHPALVHFPLALLPLAVGADSIALATNSRRLRDVGKWSIVGAAISTAVAGVFGLIAQEEVTLDAEGAKVLKTHRSLNVAVLAAVTAMALVRVRRRRPSLGYVATGVAALVTVGVSAYLGGKLVYTFGAGVERAHGASETDPQLTLGNARHAATRAAKDLGRGIVHATQDLRQGDIVPVFTSTQT
jgi:uncharacterized membrane protein